MLSHNSITVVSQCICSCSICCCVVAVRKQYPTTRRVTISSLPPTLIIHLKRFDFDFEKMANVKVQQLVALTHALLEYA